MASPSRNRRCGRGRGRREAGVKERWPPSRNRRTGEDGGAERRERKNGGSPPTIGAQERTGEARGGCERTVAPPHAIGTRERTGERRGGCESILATSYAMVAQARYVPDEKSGFLIRFLVHTVALMRGKNPSTRASAPIGGRLGTRPDRCGKRYHRRNK